MTFDWKFLLSTAQQEVTTTIAALPMELEKVVQDLPITFDPRHNGDRTLSIWKRPWAYLWEGPT